MRTREILVADDDEHDLTMICAVLEREGGGAPAPRCVRDGQEALDFLYGAGVFQGRPPGDPAVVLLDLHMPRINGWEVLRQVKADPALRAIPVIVFSSSARESDLRRCYDLGANAYVVKPIDFAQFQEVVRVIAMFWLRCNATLAWRAAAMGAPEAAPVPAPARRKRAVRTRVEAP